MEETDVREIFAPFGEIVNMDMSKDEISRTNKGYAFIAPSILGGQTAPSPVEGKGIDKIIDRINLKNVSIESIEKDILITGIIN